MPGIPTANTDISALLPKTIKGRSSPIISTAPVLRGGAREGDPVSPSGSAQLLFEDSFDNHQDWTSEQILTDQTQVPSGWTRGRTDSQFGPGGDFPKPGGHPTIEILAGGPSRTPGGKSFVKWRESIDTEGTARAGWNSDGILAKLLDSDHEEIYVEWYMTFSDSCIADYYTEEMGGGKIIGILGFDRDFLAQDPAHYFSYFTEDSSPKMMFGAGASQSGIAYKTRNAISLFARGSNNILSTLQGVPDGFSMSASGGASLSFSQGGMAGGRPGGATARLTDQLTGQPMVGDGGMHLDQVFGDETTWVKFAMWCKMNSAPGVADGEAAQWVDGQRITHFTGIPWVQAGEPMAAGWNFVRIGGNDHDIFHSRRFVYSDAAPTQAAGFSTSGPLYVRNLSTNEELTLDTDYTVSGTDVTLLGSKITDGNTLVIYDATQSWLAIDDLKVYDGIPVGVES